MKKIVILALFVTTFAFPTIVQAKSFTTISPYYPPAYRFDNNTYNRYLPPNKNQRYLPPPPPNTYHNYSRFGYYDPYYSTPKAGRLKRLKNFFNSGQITGFTPSYNNSFGNNYPYGYQSGFYDSNGNYDYKNYDIQNGMSIKILD